MHAALWLRNVKERHLLEDLGVGKGTRKNTVDIKQVTLIIKTNEMHYFSNLFWYTTQRGSDRFTVYQQESSTVYTAIYSYADCLLARSGWNILVSLASSHHNLCDINLLLCIQY
jgi:hypothetical protein